MRNKVLTLLIVAPLLLLCAVPSMGIGPFLRASVNYQTVSSPVLGAEICTDPGFDNAGAWNIQAGWAVSGSSAAATAANNTNLWQSKVRTVGELIQATTVCTGLTGGVYNLRIGGNIGPSTTTVGTVTQYLIVATADDTMGLKCPAGALSATFSSISFKPTSLTSLLAPTRPFSGSGTFSVTATDANCQPWLGGGCYLDSTRNPTKGVFWWANRTTGKMELQIMTAPLTWVSKVNTAFTYVSGQVPRFDYDSTTKIGKVYYNGVQLGGDQDLSAYSWINDNRYHTILSTLGVTAGSVPFTFIKQ